MIEWLLFLILLIILYYINVPKPHLPTSSFQQEIHKRKTRGWKSKWEEIELGECFIIPSPLGKSTCYLLGPENGKKLVFVHGITAPSKCFPDFVQGLASSGFRVFTYDLFGRGFSDSPGTPYNEALYTSQLHFLIHHLGWKRFDLVGLSLGGAIVTSFASHFPSLIDHLVLIAPAGLLDKLPLIAHFFQIPLIGPLIWYTLGKHMLTGLSESNYIPSKRSASVEFTISLTKEHVLYNPGVIRSYYSTVQYFPLCGMESQYASLEMNLQSRVAVIWGKKDKVVPFKLLNKLETLIPSVSTFVFDNDGHSICVESPDSCISSIKEFIFS